MEESLQQTPDLEEKILQQIAGQGMRMSGWLKFIGIVNIIVGALQVFSIFGIILAWIPIWLGILLMQASGKIQQAQYQKNYSELVGMMDKLRLFFMIVGIYIIIVLAITVLILFFFSSMFFGALHNFQDTIY